MTAVKKKTYSQSPFRQYDCYLLDKDGKTTTDTKTGRLHVSVSKILNVEGKDLIHWALKQFGSQPDPNASYNSFMEHTKTLGTALHKYVEHDLKKIPFPENEVTMDMIPAIKAWHEFRDKNVIDCIASERVCASARHLVAGTCDLVIRMNGKLYVADLKTGNHIYPSYFTQMAAYKSFMMEEPASRKIQGIENAELMVIRLPRDGSPVEPQTLGEFYNDRVSVQDEIYLFHCLRYIWFFRNIKSKKWTPIIKNMEEILSPLAEDFKTAFAI